MQVITNLRDIVNHAVVTNVEFQNKVAEIDDEIDALALHRLTQYNENHIEKLTEYNDNDTLKMDQYNANHIERLENINYAYADRIVEMIKTRNFMGIMDEYVAKTSTHMITFLDTTDANYIYYANGTLLAENVDYTVYDNKTIELTVKANPYDVIIQVNTQVLRDMLTAEGVLFASMLGQPNGVAGLDVSGKVPSEQLPSYVDDVLEFPTYADLPVEGETGKIYVVVADETSNGDTSSYRWTGTTYAIVSNTLNISDIKALYEANPDTNAYTDIDKSEVATIQSRLDTKQDTLVDGVNIKTVNGNSLLGPDNLLVSVGASGFAANVYLTNQVASTDAACRQLSYTPDDNTSEVVGVINHLAEVLLESYIFDGDVVADFIPAGEWQLSFSRKVSNASGTTVLRFAVVKRSALGAETELFSISSQDIKDTDYAHENIIHMQPSYDVDPTDRIGLKVYANTTIVNNTTVSLQVGDGNAAYLVSPLGLRHNQLRARGELNAHPISSITGLEYVLSDLQENIDIITSIEEW